MRAESRTGALVLLPGSPLNTRSSHLISWVFIFCFIQMKMFAIDTAAGIGGRGSKWDTLEENNLKTRQCYEHRRSCRDEHSAQQPGACVRGTIEQMRKRNWETFFFFSDHQSLWDPWALRLRLLGELCVICESFHLGFVSYPVNWSE